MDSIIARRLAIVTTTRCTLRCKLCSNFMPKFVKPADVPYADIVADVDHAFELFDRIEWLQFVGGEIFMNRDMADVYNYCLKYRGHFDKLVLMTNATILPNAKEIEALGKYGENCQIQISDYGELSHKMKETCMLYEKHGIPYIMKTYYGDAQHFGGWIDNSKLLKSNETTEQAHKRTLGCQQVKLKNMHCYRGQLNRCSQSCFMYASGFVKPNEGDFVDLNDASMSTEKKREIIENFYKYPRASCFYCVWSEMEKNVLPRFPAAEQLAGNDL
ncbi:MAG: radical SAM protein [Dysgonamonadaceae bacterium]|jgi:hypothetical protein|nr:radical SAM protein [Dysgonamonadaceae bacterium]